jgi:hypothetical protein
VSIRAPAYVSIRVPQRTHRKIIAIVQMGVAHMAYSRSKRCALFVFLHARESLKRCLIRALIA